MNKNETSRLAKTIAADCIAIRVRLLNRVITNLYDRALRPFGITINQATILVLLSIAGTSSPGEIGRVLMMEKSTVSRNLDRMRKNGWIEISAGDDGLAHVVKATLRGKNLLSSMHGEWSKAQRAASELLGKEGVGAVRKLYDTVRRDRKKPA